MAFRHPTSLLQFQYQSLALVRLRGHFRPGRRAGAGVCLL